MPFPSLCTTEGVAYIISVFRSGKSISLFVGAHVCHVSYVISWKFIGSWKIFIWDFARSPGLLAPTCHENFPKESVIRD